MMNVEYSTVSKKGNRSINEDSVGVCRAENDCVFCLADGLGGHGKGEVASQIVVNTAIAAFKGDKDRTGLANCFVQAQDSLLKEQSKEHTVNGMMSTLVVLSICGDTALWGHVGDSRLYLFRKNRFFMRTIRTLDHSIAQQLCQIGEIKDRNIRFHEERSKITHAMGAKWKEPEYELADPVSIAPGDVFLLCSDGFWELITEKEMIKLLKKSKSSNSWLAEMEAVVLRNGQGKNMDNYSAIAVFIKKEEA